MKNEITLQRYTIELLINALEAGAKDNVYSKGAVIHTQVNIIAV